MSLLSNLFDKYIIPPNGREYYLPIYDQLFTEEFCGKINNILEIGIGTKTPNVNSTMLSYENYKTGDGLYMWQEFLPNAQIYGIDIQSDTLIKGDRLHTAICNSTDSLEVESFFKNNANIMMDVIIDDGSHIHQDQLKTLKNFYPHLANGGLYILEDVGSYIEDFYLPTAKSICVNGTVDLMNFEGQQLLIIKKFQ